MKHNAIRIARGSARIALLSNVRNAFRASTPWIGLHSLNPAHASRCIERKRHSTRSSGGNIDNVGRKLLSLFDDTIYALSTAPGRAGIAVIRISGPACLDVCS
jgi:tRNA modification GTPase